MVTNNYNDLNQWEQIKFIIRYLREIHGLTDNVLIHTYAGDNSAYDSGIINWTKFREEQNKPKVRKQSVKQPKKKIVCIQQELFGGNIQ